MKYLDEFRDSAKARILVTEIEALVATMDIPHDRPLHIMEVCGGHTHSIFRYGIQQHAAGRAGIRAWPGLSGLRAADGTGR